MPSRTHSRSPYMQFAKLRSGASYNLATSGIMSYPLAELPVKLEDLEISGTDSLRLCASEGAAGKAKRRDTPIAWSLLRVHRWRIIWRWLRRWSRARKRWWSIPPMSCW